MLRIGPEPSESDIDHAVGAVGRHEDPELADDSAQVGRGDLSHGPLAVGGDPLVADDRDEVALGLEHGLGAGYIVEVGEEDGHDGCRAVLAELGDGMGHLLDVLSGVDGDHSIGPLDERLVRQPVAHEGPHPGAHLRERGCQPIGVGDVVPMGDLTGGHGHGGRGVRLETAGTPGCRHSFSVGLKHLGFLVESDRPVLVENDRPTGLRSDQAQLSHWPVTGSIKKQVGQMGRDSSLRATVASLRARARAAVIFGVSVALPPSAGMVAPKRR